MQEHSKLGKQEPSEKIPSVPKGRKSRKQTPKLQRCMHLIKQEGMWANSEKLWNNEGAEQFSNKQDFSAKQESEQDRHKASKEYGNARYLKEFQKHV